MSRNQGCDVLLKIRPCVQDRGLLWCSQRNEDWSYQVCVRGSSCCLLVGFWKGSRRSNFLLIHYIFPSFPDAPAWYECICCHKGKKAAPETSITSLSTTVRTGLFLKPVLTSPAQHRSPVTPPLPPTRPPPPDMWICLVFFLLLLLFFQWVKTMLDELVPCGTLIFSLYFSIYR